MNWRNTIPWKLECEMQGLDRQVGYEQFGIRLDAADIAMAERTEHASSTALISIYILQGLSCSCGTLTNIFTSGEAWFCGALCQGC